MLLPCQLPLAETALRRRIRWDRSVVSLVLSSRRSACRSPQGCTRRAGSRRLTLASCGAWRLAPGGRKPSDGTLQNLGAASPHPHVTLWPMGLWPHVVMCMACSGRLVWMFGIMSFQLIIYTNTTSYMYNLRPPSMPPEVARLVPFPHPLEPSLFHCLVNKTKIGNRAW